MTATETMSRVDLVAKLLAFALDPAASIGEAKNAAARMVEIARRENVRIEHLREFIAPAPIEIITDPVERPPACDVLMGFGRFEGEPLGWIAENHPDYLVWLATEAKVRRPALRDAIEIVHAYYLGSEGQ